MQSLCDDYRFLKNMLVVTRAGARHPYTRNSILLSTLSRVAGNKLRIGIAGEVGDLPSPAVDYNCPSSVPSRFRSIPIH